MLPRENGAYATVRPDRGRGANHLHARARTGRTLCRALEYACVLKGTVPAVARGEVAFSSPRLSSFKASHIIASDDDRAALLSALAAMRPDDSPLTEGEF